MTAFLGAMAMLSGASAKVVYATEVEEALGMIVCPADAAPKDIVCSPDRQFFSVCPKAGALALALKLKQGDTRCSKEAQRSDEPLTYS